MTPLAKELKIVDLTVYESNECYAKNNFITEKNNISTRCFNTIRLQVGDPIKGSNGAIFYDSYIIDANKNLKWIPYSSVSEENVLLTKKIKDFIEGKSLEDIVKLFKE